MTVNLLYLEDNPADQELMRFYTTRIEGVKVDCVDQLQEVSEIDKYDGIIVDQYLSQDLGLEYAYLIQKYDWLKPVMLFTGDQSLVHPDTKVVVDEVCSKDSLSNFTQAFAAFLRQVNRIKHLKAKLDEEKDKQSTITKKNN